MARLDDHERAELGMACGSGKTLVTLCADLQPGQSEATLRRKALRTRTPEFCEKQHLLPRPGRRIG
jgi:hypothetical protein